MPTIGDRIKEVREQHRWTQERLAKETGISKGFLSEVENNKGTGNIGADYVLRIANALGVSLDYLMRGEVGQQERAREPVTIPRTLSEAAQQLGLSYAETLTVLDAHQAVIARRSATSLREPTTEEWKALWKAIRQVYSDAPRLKTDPTIARLAADLNLRGSNDPSAAIVRFCHKTIQGYLTEIPCATLSELLALAMAKLDTVFLEIRDDEQLRAIEQQYLQRREVAFVNLARQLGPEAYAITFVLKHPEPRGRRFVSLIDCRGPKRYRAYFSKWHELAHLLTLTSQMRLKFCRTHAEPAQKDPEEALMDVIAGEVGFFPALVAKHAHGSITFEKIETLREELCPEASRQAAVIGFVKAWPRPALLVQGRLATQKKHQQQDGFAFHTPPSMALRAVKVTVNDAAKTKGMLIPPNMRIPERSVIHRAFVRSESLLPQAEDLSWWESQGVARPPLPVHVEARSGHDSVDALITI